MKQSSFITHAAQTLAAAGCVVLLSAPVPAAAQAAQAALGAEEAVDMSEQMPQAQAVKEGLFPEDECEQLRAAGFKCMGFKPAVRYSLPASSFSAGSADLPGLLRGQLDVFAEVLRGKRGSKQMVRIEGHADASGAKDANRMLSQRRAEAVKQYLVKNGADDAMLQAVGVGAERPKVIANPFAPENRRVEIGRANMP